MPGKFPDITDFLQNESATDGNATTQLPLIQNESATDGNATTQLSQRTLGVTKNITSEFAAMLGLENITGLVMTDASGNTILELDDFTINQTNNILAALEGRMPAELINLTLFRNDTVEPKTILMLSKDLFPTFAEVLAGKYINSDADLEIELPQGWKGFRTRGTIDVGIVSPQVLNISSFEKQNVTMTISVTDLPFLNRVISQVNRGFTSATNNTDSITQGSLQECKRLSELYPIIKGAETLDIVEECYNLEDYAKKSIYTLATPQELITLTFRANSDELYDEYLPKFNESLSTLKVENPINITEVLATE